MLLLSFFSQKNGKWKARRAHRLLRTDSQISNQIKFKHVYYNRNHVWTKTTTQKKKWEQNLSATHLLVLFVRFQSTVSIFNWWYLGSFNTQERKIYMAFVDLFLWWIALLFLPWVICLLLCWAKQQIKKEHEIRNRYERNISDCHKINQWTLIGSIDFGAIHSIYIFSYTHTYKIISIYLSNCGCFDIIRLELSWYAFTMVCTRTLVRLINWNDIINT